MKKNKIFQVNSDERGSILDIVSKEEYDALTMIISKKNAIRGNHYHKHTIQTVYIHSGKLRSLTRLPGENIKSTILNPGDILTTIEYEHHALIALEDSTFFVLTRGPRGGMDYETDTFRLEKPLQDEIE